MSVELDYCHSFVSISALCCQYLSVIWQYFSTVLSISVSHLTVPQHCTVSICHWNWIPPEDYIFPGCDNVLLSEWFPSFWRTVVPTSSLSLTERDTERATALATLLWEPPVSCSGSRCVIQQFHENCFEFVAKLLIAVLLLLILTSNQLLNTCSHATDSDIISMFRRVFWAGPVSTRINA